MELTPIFRIEKFLDAIINSTTPPEPVFRVEYFLAKIAGADVVTPEPLFRIEKYLAKILGEDVEIPEPAHRIEYWLAKKCGEDVETPDPVFRVEYWLEEWCGGSAPTYQTITGRIVSFLTQRIAPLKIEADLEPIQSGTGDPSPDNVRPISGHSGADIFVEDEYDAQADPTVQISFGSTVYGGKLTVNEDGTGSVVATMASVSSMTRGSVDTTGKLYLIADLNNAETWTSTSDAPPLISNALKSLGLTAARNSADPCVSQYGTKIYAGGYIGKESELDALLQSLVVVYPLATPITIPLTPGQVNALLGNNTVWVDDSDNISVTYQSN